MAWNSSPRFPRSAIALRGPRLEIRVAVSPASSCKRSSSCCFPPSCSAGLRSRFGAAGCRRRLQPAAPNLERKPAEQEGGKQHDEDLLHELAGETATRISKRGPRKAIALRGKRGEEFQAI